jgi:ribosome-binding protein aMBF1 (putative translation factor)
MGDGQRLTGRSRHGDEGTTDETRSAFPGFRDIGRDRQRVVSDLAASRRSLGLTQTEVAERMGTSQSAVARLEALGGDARVSTLERYAAALGCRLRWELGPPTAKGDPS